MTPTNQTPDAPRLTPNPPSDFAWKDDDATGGVAITRFLDETATTCVIPAEIEGRPITAIANRAFEDRDKLQSVVVLSGDVWLVGYRAFSGCSSLTQVVLRRVFERWGAKRSNIAARWNRSAFQTRCESSAKTRLAVVTLFVRSNCRRISKASASARLTIATRWNRSRFQRPCRMLFAAGCLEKNRSA